MIYFCFYFFFSIKKIFFSCAVSLLPWLCVLWLWPSGGFWLRWCLTLPAELPWARRVPGFSSPVRAQGLWPTRLVAQKEDLPGPGIEPVFPALAGGILTTDSLGKPCFAFQFFFFFPPGNMWKVLAMTQDPAAPLLLPSYLILCGSFLQSCLFQSLSASCQLVFSENYSTGRCIFNVFVLGREFYVLLLHRLDLLPQIKKKKS